MGAIHQLFTYISLQRKAMDDKIKLKEEQEAFKVCNSALSTYVIFRDKSVGMTYKVYLLYRRNYAQCKKQHNGEDHKVMMTHCVLQAT